MREIKFRGRSTGTYATANYNTIKKGDWVYGHLYRDYESAELCIDGVPVDPETVGEFTGVLTRNGEEIYEGQTVEVKVDNQAVEAVVVFREAAFLIECPQFAVTLHVHYPYVTAIHDHART